MVQVEYQQRGGLNSSSLYLDGEAILPTFEIEADKRGGKWLALRVVLGGVSAAVVHALLKVCASPRSGRTRAPVFVPVRVSKVDCFHRAAAIIAVVGFGIAVIEAAAAVEVGPAHHGVDGFRVVAGGDAFGLVDVVPVP